jgi:hypothetical protein
LHQVRDLFELNIKLRCHKVNLTNLHVSGVTITHLQEHETIVTTASGNRYTVLLSAAIVEELEPVSVCCGWRFVLLNMGDSDGRNM